MKRGIIMQNEYRAPENTEQGFQNYGTSDGFSQFFQDSPQYTGYTNQLLEQIAHNQEIIIYNQEKSIKQRNSLISCGSIVALMALIQIIIWALYVFGVVRILL